MIFYCKVANTIEGLTDTRRCNYVSLEDCVYADLYVNYNVRCRSLVVNRVNNN